MEKNDKEPETFKHRSYFLIKVLLIVLCVVVVVQFAVVAKGFASLKALSNRLNALEEEKTLPGFESPRSEAHGTTRSKRSTEGTDLKKALLKLEERFNQSYQYLGYKHVLLLKGHPGKPGPPGKAGVRGERGPAGPKGLEVGVSYTRWGKKTCPGTGATLVYEGYVGGSLFTQRGGASNYVCLTRVPIYEKYKAGSQRLSSRIYGGEYQIEYYGIYPKSLHQHDVPCAVCHVTKRTSQIMIPGRNACPAGWTREYKGYLMAEKHDHHRTMYTCVDQDPDYTRGTHANLNGALFYYVEGICGTLPCKPYIEGRELTCAVCTR